MDTFVELFKYMTVVGIISVIVLRPALFVKIADTLGDIIADAMRLGGSTP